MSFSNRIFRHARNLQAHGPLDELRHDHLTAFPSGTGATVSTPWRLVEELADQDFKRQENGLPPIGKVRYWCEQAIRSIPQPLL